MKPNPTQNQFSGTPSIVTLTIVVILAFACAFGAVGVLAARPIHFEPRAFSHDTAITGDGNAVVIGDRNQVSANAPEPEPEPVADDTATHRLTSAIQFLALLVLAVAGMGFWVVTGMK